jgi:hypothetical protein
MIEKVPGLEFLTGYDDLSGVARGVLALASGLEA